MLVKQIFRWQTPGRSIAEMPTSGDLKSGYSLLFTPPPHHRRNFNISPPPQQIDPAPNGNDLGHYNYEVLHEVYTIKSHNHHFDARNNLCQMASLPI